MMTFTEDGDTIDVRLKAESRITIGAQILIQRNGLGRLRTSASTVIFLRYAFTAVTRNKTEKDAWDAWLAAHMGKTITVNYWGRSFDVRLSANTKTLTWTTNSYQHELPIEIEEIYA